MSMEIMQQSHNGTGLFGWLNFERRNWLAIAICTALAGFSVGNGHTTQGSIVNISQQLGQKKAVIKKLETVDIPKIKAVAGCQAAKADVATKVVRGAADRADIPACPPPSSVAALGHR